MPLHPSAPELLLRLLLAVIAGGLIGFNRGAQGHAMGLRTTILVGLAAAVAMIQANILLSTGGKVLDSFSVMDVMRLPLGILTGVGFIGGGAILRRGDLVRGVTTAATLWMMTVIGLCLGGGQLVLGMGATVLSIFVLFALKWLDARIAREHHARLIIECEFGSIPFSELNERILPMGYHAQLQSQSSQEDSRNVRLRFGIYWKRPETAGPPFDLLNVLNAQYRVISFETESGPRP